MPLYRKYVLSCLWAGAIVPLEQRPEEDVAEDEGEYGFEAVSGAP